MNVFGWTADSSGCGYYRLALPLGQLGGALGIQTSFSTKLPSDWQENVNMIVGQRVSNVGASSTWQRISKDRPDIKLVYEVDDDLFTTHPTNKRAHDFFGTAEVSARVRANATAAHAITVSNQHLAEVMRQFNVRGNIYVLPNMIDESALVDSIPPPGSRKALTIGWAGSDSHLFDFRTIQYGLGQVLAKHPARMHFVGANFGKMFRLRPGQWRYTRWNEDIHQYYRSLDFDIGLAPLADTKFNRSKSHIKALEYAARGIPVIASRIPDGPYNNFVLDGQTGFLVRNEREFQARLTELINDEDLRLTMGRNARLRAQNFTIQRHAHRWADAYEKISEV